MYNVKYVRTLSSSLIGSNYDGTRIWKLETAPPRQTALENVVPIKSMTLPRS